MQISSKPHHDPALFGYLEYADGTLVEVPLDVIKYIQKLEATERKYMKLVYDLQCAMGEL